MGTQATVVSARALAGREGMLSAVTSPEGSQAARDRAFERPFLVGLFLVLLALAWLFPLSSDDWGWGSQLGLDRLTDGFQEINGRYGGNLLAIGLVRVPVLAHVFVALVLCLTVFLLQELTGHRTPTGYGLTTLLLLAMPLAMWRQSIVWLSGFVNYATAGLLMLVVLWFIKRDWVRPGRRHPLELAAVPLLGVSAQLFMEHVTTYLLVAAFFHVALLAVRRGAVPATAVLWLVSLAIGAAIMFANGAYGIAASRDSYLRFEPAGDASGAGGVVHQAVTAVSRFGVVDNAALNWALLLLVCGLAALSPRARWRVGLPATAAAFVGLTTALRVAQASDTLVGGWEDLSGVAALLLTLVLLGSALRLVADHRRAVLVVVALGSLGVLLAPLTSVQPIGPRCFYPSYLLLVGIASLLARDLSSRVAVDVDRWVAPFLGLLVTASVAVYFAVYANVDRAASQRLDTIRDQVRQGATEVTVYRLPYPSYVWDGDPSHVPLEERYKTYYGIPAYVKIVVIPRPTPKVVPRRTYDPRGF